MDQDANALDLCGLDFGSQHPRKIRVKGIRFEHGDRTTIEDRKQVGPASASIRSDETKRTKKHNREQAQHQHPESHNNHETGREVGS
ncbi:hypothetical protein R1flu_004894 [Riccia fluitans]|uniref:Uncharacterized protein n=1 Tax=Riccia fluitans TaxID=41844 RepID=A0ABD1YSF1_9MARC